MFTPNPSTASQRLVEFFGLYLLSRLLGSPLTATFAALFQKAQAELEQADAAERAANRTVVHLTAVRDTAVEALDEAVGSLELKVLDAVSRNREADEYKVLFPQGLMGIVDSPLADRIELVRTLVTSAAKGRPEFVAFAKKLSAALAAAEKAMTDLQLAENAHTVAQTEEFVARDAWIRAYRATYGMLVTAFPGNRKKVERFFRSTKKRVEALPKGPSTPETPAQAA